MSVLYQKWSPQKQSKATVLISVEQVVPQWADLLEYGGGS